MSLFGTSGIRTIFNKDLVNLAFRVGLALGKESGSVVVGTDTRSTRDVLKHAVISGLLAGGARCADAGILPTPTLALATRGYDAGVMVTASHNPPEYNGLKLLNPDGSSFGSPQQGRLEKAILAESTGVAPWQEIKRSDIHEGAVELHITRILSLFQDGLKIKVVVDAGGGAASLVTPHLLERMGCEVIAINCTPDGRFPRPIEPTDANLEELKRTVKETGARLGVAHDGDADRMMAVDEQGCFISGDRLLVILARAVGAREVVTTQDASIVIDEMGFEIRRTRVGDTFVSEELKKGGDFGGETSGAWIFPEISLCPDGIYAAALMATIASRQSLSELAGSIPLYPLMRGSVDSDGVVKSTLESNLRTMKPLSVSNTDGIKLNFEDGWLLVRASGTEPKIRLTAEAKNEARVRQLYDAGLKAIKDSGSKGKTR